MESQQYDGSKAVLAKGTSFKTASIAVRPEKVSVPSHGNSIPEPMSKFKRENSLPTSFITTHHVISVLRYEKVNKSNLFPFFTTQLLNIPS